jgi:uncharacterized protein
MVYHEHGMINLIILTQFELQGYVLPLHPFGRTLYTFMAISPANRIIRLAMYELSLFPLDTVLFPGTPIHLHIFEPRYRKMMNRCISEDRPFGVVLIRRGLEAGGALAEPHPVGCTARIASVEPLPDGRMNLVGVGEECFRILELNHEQSYLVGQVEGLPIERPHSIDMLRGARALAPWVRRYLVEISQMEPAYELDLSNLQLPEDPLLLIYWAASLLQIPALEKQPLLEARRAADLLDGVLRLYRRETALLGQMMGSSRADEASRSN